MPKKISSEFVYACDICGMRCRNASQKDARMQAVNCEFIGTPYTHKYKVGDMVSVRFIKPFIGDVKISELAFERKTHKPAYFAGQIFIIEREIEGLCPER